MVFLEDYNIHFNILKIDSEIVALSAAILENGGKFSTDGQYLTIYAETVHPTTTTYRNKVVEHTILHTFGDRPIQVLHKRNR